MEALEYADEHAEIHQHAAAGRFKTPLSKEGRVQSNWPALCCRVDAFMLHSRNAIVPTRFLVTIAHLTAVIMCFFGMESNVVSGLDLSYESSQYDSAKSNVVGALSVTVICIVIDLFGLFSGVTLKINVMNWFQILWHFVALGLTIMFLLDNWHSSTMWYIFAFFVGPVTICEAGVITSTLFLGFRKY